MVGDRFSVWEKFLLTNQGTNHFVQSEGWLLSASLLQPMHPGPITSHMGQSGAWVAVRGTSRDEYAPTVFLPFCFRVLFMAWHLPCLFGASSNGVFCRHDSLIYHLLSLPVSICSVIKRQTHFSIYLSDIRIKLFLL